MAIVVNNTVLHIWKVAKKIDLGSSLHKEKKKVPVWGKGCSIQNVTDRTREKLTELFQTSKPWGKGRGPGSCPETEDPLPPPVDSADGEEGGCPAKASSCCRHYPCAMPTSTPSGSPDALIFKLLHVLLYLEYCFSFLELVNIYSSFQTKPKCCFFKKPLLNTPSYLAPAPDLTLWCSAGCICLSLLLL